MSFKTTYILFAVLAGVLIVLGVVLYLGPTGGDATAYALPSMHAGDKPVPAGDIDTVEIQHVRPKPETLVFVRDRDKKKWRMIKPYELRVDTFQIDRLVNEVVDARKDEKADLGSNLAEWGLDEPSTVITLKAGADREWKLNLGKERPGLTTGVVYATSSDRPKEPMAIKRSELDLAFKPLNEYRTKDLVAESSFNMTRVSLQEPKKPAVVLDKTADGRWRFEQPPYGDAAEEGEMASATQDKRPITGVRELLQAFQDLKVPSDADFVAEGVQDFAKYGLGSEPELLRIEIKSKPAGEGKEPAEQEVVLIGKKADDKGDKRYARLDGESAVVRISAKSIDPILQVVANPAVLRNRDLVDIDQPKTDAIDITNAAGAVRLRKPLATWQLYEAGKPRAADDSAVSDLLTALTAKRQVKDFPDPAKEADYGFAKPEAVISLWVGGIQPEEKKDEAKDEAKKDDKAADKKDKDKKKQEAEPKLKDAQPTVKLTFGKKDRDLVYVRREKGADKTIVQVPAAILAKVTQGRLAYLDKTLPSFSEAASVTAVAIHRGGQTYDVEKEKDVWKLKQPKDLAGRTADARTVDRVIADLRGLHPEKLAADKPAPADLDKFGLKAPAVKATVKVENKETKKPEDWVYLFGKETDDKTGVYAKVEKSDLVVVVRPTVLETLRSDLRDPTVFHFDPTKVKAVKLVGWKQVVGSTFTLDLERKAPGQWAVKAPSDFDLDSSQVESFIAGLADLRAEKLVARKPDMKERPLHVEITVEGEKAPLTLTIGELDAKAKTYYCQSSTLPNEGFLLPQSHFEAVLAGAKYFSKKPPAKS